MKQFLTILSLVLLTNLAFGQNDTVTNLNYDRRNIIKSVDTLAYNKYKSSYAITRDTLNVFPDSLIIEGKLVDYTMGISCGFFCGCGTFKIRLTKQNNNYKSTFIYVGVPCLTNLPKGIKKRVTWTLYKLPMNDKRCYWTEVPMNKFDTNGLPFYTLTRYNKSN